MPISSSRAVPTTPILDAVSGRFLRAQTVEIGFDSPSRLSGPFACVTLTTVPPKPDHYHYRGQCPHSKGSWP